MMQRGADSFKPLVKKSLPAAEFHSDPTEDSVFADSAVDIGRVTPVSQLEGLLETPESLETELQYEDARLGTNHQKTQQVNASDTSPLLDDTQLSVEGKSMLDTLDSFEQATDYEAGDEQHEQPRRMGYTQFHEQNESQMAAENKQLDNGYGPMVEAQHDEDGAAQDYIDEDDLIAVQTNLAQTVLSMRLRQQEHHHLYELTLHRLETVASRCLMQEQKIRDLVQQVQRLTGETDSLSRENAELKSRCTDLESNASRKDVAVNAMASAVTGLEGWLQETERSRSRQATPVRHGPGRKVVIRGRGRFRGKYYIDDEDRGNDDLNLPTSTREMQDGVMAWIRGFRDVEECASSPASPRPSGEVHRRPGAGEDDWGEFESPSIDAR